MSDLQRVGEAAGVAGAAAPSPVDDVVAALDGVRSRGSLPSTPSTLGDGVFRAGEANGGTSSGATPTPATDAIAAGNGPTAAASAPPAEEDAGDLVPRSGNHPTENVRYQTVVLTDIPNAASSDRVRPLDGPVDLFDDGIGLYTAPGEGVVVTSEQTWTVRGVTLGRLLHSLALAPGESTRVAVLDWTRRDGGTLTDTLGQTEQTTARTTDARTTTDTARSSARDQAEGSTTAGTAATSMSGGFSAGVAGPTFGVGVSGSASRTSSLATTVARSSDAKEAAASAAQDISAQTEQAAAAARTRQSAVVRETSQTEGETVSTRVVTNYNHMHAMSVQYYEVVQVYEVVTTPIRIDRCVFVPLAPLTFTGSVLRRYAPVLADAAPPAWQRQLLAADPFATTVDRTRAGGAPSSILSQQASGQVVDRVTQTPLRHIAAAGDGTVWGIDTQGVPQRWNPTSRAWSPVATGLGSVTLRRISVGRSDVVWAVADDGTVHSLDAATATWQARPGPLRTVSCGRDGSVWGIGPQNDLVSWRGGSWQGNYQRGGTDVAVGAQVFLLGVDRSLSWIDPVAQVWAGGGAAQPVTAIAAAADGSLWGTSDDDRVYQWDGRSTFAAALLDVPAAARLTVVAPVSARDVWGLDPNGYPVHVHDPRPTVAFDERADSADPRSLTVWWDGDGVVRGIELTTTGAAGRAMRVGDTDGTLLSATYSFSAAATPSSVRIHTSGAEGGSVGQIEVVAAGTTAAAFPPVPAAGLDDPAEIPLDGVTLCGLFGEIGQSSRGRFVARLGFFVRAQASPEDLLRHLNDNRDHYSRAVWANADELTLSRVLATYAYDPSPPRGAQAAPQEPAQPVVSVPLGACVDPQPVAITGNYLAFRWNHPSEADRQAWLAASGLVEGDTSTGPHTVVSLPSGGVFAEAVLGRSNAAEKLDLTRFWNWKDSPIPILPPEILPVATASRAREVTLNEAGFDPALARLQSLRGLPDPTGLREITQTLSQTIFADMSKATETAALAADALKTASTGDQAAGQRSLETYKAALAHQEATTRLAIEAATTLLPLASPGLAAGAALGRGGATSSNGAGGGVGSTGLDTITALAGVPGGGAPGPLGRLAAVAPGGTGNGGLPGSTISDTGGLVNLVRTPAPTGSSTGPGPTTFGSTPFGTTAFGSPPTGRVPSTAASAGGNAGTPTLSTSAVADEIVKEVGIPALQSALRANPALLDMPADQVVRLLGDALVGNLRTIVDVRP